jgi:hypothetical protein
MTSLPVILIKDSIDSLQSNLSESIQYMLVSESSESSDSSEPSNHPKALFPYPVIRVSIPILNMYLS